MNGRPFVTLTISVRLYMQRQVNGDTPATRWPDCNSASYMYMQPYILVSNIAARFICFRPPAILLSFQAVLSFLLVLFFLDKAYLANL